MTATLAVASIADKFPVGTSVGAYARSDWPVTTAPSGAPPGSAVASAAVGSDGSLSIAGLAYDTRYMLGASVGGTWRYVNAKTVTDPTLDDVSQAEMTAAIAAAQSTDQPLDSDLTAIAALATTSFGRALLTSANAGALLITAGGQASDSDLTAMAALATTAYGRSFLALADAAAARTLVGLDMDLATQAELDAEAAARLAAAAAHLAVTGLSGHIPAGGVTSAMIADGTIAVGDLAFDPATQAELDAEAALLDRDQGQAGMMVPPNRVTTATRTANANQAFLSRFRPSRNMTITKVAFNVRVAALSDDNVDVGIYSAAGARLGSVGSTAGKLNSTGMKVLTLTGAVNLVAGTVYYCAIAFGPIGSTGATIDAWDATPSSGAQYFGTAAPACEAFNKATSFPLPDPIVLDTTNFGAYPTFAVRES